MSQITLGFIAIAIGLTAGVLLFVPFVAVAYRRHGRLTFTHFLISAAALIYFWAIWVYTLLPLPNPNTIQCVSAITDPMSVVHDLQTALNASGSLLRQPAFLQLAFNVLLFMPLGFFLRVLGKRGVVTALATGFGLSLLIELTQLTGVWGLYPCSYRFFDVGDLMTNTSGALLGSLVAFVVPRHLRTAQHNDVARMPLPVTRSRRVLAALCDVLGFWLVSFAVALIVQLGFYYADGSSSQAVAHGHIASLIGTGAASAVWFVVIAATGQSVGDMCVQLRYRGSALPQVVTRPLRWLGGVAGIAAIGLLGSPFPAVSSALYVLAALLLVFTRHGRGLPGVLSAQHLVDARE